MMQQNVAASGVKLGLKKKSPNSRNILTKKIGGGFRDFWKFHPGIVNSSHEQLG